MLTNPYNEKLESAKFHAWQHGAGALDQHDNPYSSNGDEEELYTIWMEAFTGDHTKQPQQLTKNTIKEQQQKLPVEQQSPEPLPVEPPSDKELNVLLLELKVKLTPKIQALREKKLDLLEAAAKVEEEIEAIEAIFKLPY